jgi:UDP-GlcNAc3NAcA epimerase
MKILSVIGARPQFIKHAAVDLAFKKVPNISIISVHTGQHYDARMSDIFFDELKISKPDYFLNVGSAGHGKQTGQMMIELEEVMMEQKPDAILVYGDTNSTFAGALVASKLHIPVIHIEAGLRSFNKRMPEEINRILTDHVSSLLFVPSKEALNQLKKESVDAECHLVGDVMFDMIKLVSPMIRNGQNSQYYLATIHRPYNTDDIHRLHDILKGFDKLALPVKFPAHPRTIGVLQRNSIPVEEFSNVSFLEPQSYVEMMKLLKNSQALITDSGGMQKEAYWMQKKCITLRSETEWTETLINGWNTLIFDDLSLISEALKKETGDYIPGLYGNGNAADEIVQKIVAFLDKRK